MRHLNAPPLAAHWHIHTIGGNVVTRTECVFSPCTTNRPEFHPKNKGWAKTMRTRTNQYLIWPEFFFLLLFFRVRRESIFNFHRSGVVLVGLSQMAVESCCTSVRRCSSIDGGNFHYLCWEKRWNELRNWENGTKSVWQNRKKKETKKKR